MTPARPAWRHGPRWAALALALLGCNDLFGLAPTTLAAGAGGQAGEGGLGGSGLEGGGGLGGAGGGGSGGSGSGGVGGLGGATPGSSVSALDVGEYHACAIVAGEVICWGDGSNGALGAAGVDLEVGDEPGELEAQPPVDLADPLATAVVTGTHHSCALAGDGVHCWGQSYQGQCGVYGTGASQNTVDLGARQATRLRSTGNHVCVVASSDEVLCWGRNDYFQLGLDDTDDRGDDVGEMGDGLTAVALGGGVVLDLCAGFDFTCALLSESDVRHVRCWGHNDAGQVGVDPALDDVIPVAEAPKLLEAENVEALSCGRFHVCARTAEGALRCWGQNVYGQLAQGTSTTSEHAPVSAQLGSFAVLDVAAGGHHTCAVLEHTSSLARVMKCWGANGYGQLGLDSDDPGVGTMASEIGNALAAVALPAGFVPLRVHASYGTTCVVSDAQRALCFGGNEAGLLGQGTGEPALGDAANDVAALEPLTF